MQVAHHSLTPLRSPGDGASSHVKFIVGAAIRKPNLVRGTNGTNGSIIMTNLIVFLNDFAPPNPRFKYTYLQELSLPSRIKVFTYHYGNNLGSLYYAWRVPADPANYDPAKSQKLISEIKRNIKEYHSKEMRRQFISRFNLVINATLSVMSELYQFLTNDSSSTSISDDVKV